MASDRYKSVFSLGFSSEKCQRFVQESEVGQIVTTCAQKKSQETLILCQSRTILNDGQPDGPIESV